MLESISSTRDSIPRKHSEAEKENKHILFNAMPSKKCEHGRQKHICRECGGSQICEHNRIRSRCKECPCSSAAVKPPLAGAVSRRMQAGEPLAGKKRKRQAAPGSPDAMGKRRSSGKEPADYEEALASSDDDGEWCGRYGAGECGNVKPSPGTAGSTLFMDFPGLLLYRGGHLGAAAPTSYAALAFGGRATHSVHCTTILP